MAENEKKMSAGKLVGIIICVLSAVLVCVLWVVDIYLGGRIKTIDKCCSAIVHNNYEEYISCFSENTKKPPTSESEFNELRAEYIKQWGEDFRIKADFVSADNGKKGYEVTVKFTVYNDIDNESEISSILLVRESGKWLISE